MTINKALIIFSLLFISCSVAAQYFKKPNDSFKKLNIEKGLSQNKINCIIRDSNGYVWIGTGNGLNRFDGNNVKIIKKEFDSGYNLRDIEIFDLYEDNSGDIWIASGKGLFKYNQITEEIVRFNIAGSLIKDSTIECIEVENDTQLWLGTNGGLKLFDKNSGIVIKEYGNMPYEPYSLSNDHIYSVCCYNDDVWVGTRAGLNKLNRKTGLFDRYYHDINQSNSIGGNIIRNIEKDNLGNLWIGTELGGLTLYNSDIDGFVNYNTSNSKIPHNDVRDIFCLPTDELLIATNGGGLSLLDINTKYFSTIKSDALNVNSLSNNAVYTVYQDFDNILWLGLYAGGLNYRTNEINNFKTIVHLPGKKNSICENNARSLYLDKTNNLWIGTLGGLSKFEFDSQSYLSYSNIMNDNQSLSFNTVTSVLEDTNGNTWVGTYSGGVNLLKKNSTKFIRYKNNKHSRSSLSGNNIYSIIEDENGIIWVATSNGLNYYSANTDSWTRALNFDIRDIVEHNGKFYLASKNGIIEYDKELGTYEIFTNDKFENALFVSLTVGEGNSLFFGTQGHGFGVFSLEEKKFELFDTNNGLPSNFIASIEKDNANNIWISTYRGLSLFNQKTRKFTNYGLADGLPFLEFHPKSSILLPDGTMAFGGSNGIVLFDPEKIVTNSTNSRLVFNDFKVDGSSVGVGIDSPLNTNISLTKDIELKYAENDFSFGFVDINYINSGLGEYEFKLENYMDNWNYLGNQTSIRFTNMDPGSYTLKVRKVGGNSTINSEIRMDIVIVNPFWKTWYFYVIVVLFVFFLMFLYNKYTLISISRQNNMELQNLEYEKYTEFNTLRMKFFTYISHELRTPLSLIVDPLNVLLENNNNNPNHKYLQLIKNNSNRLERLVDQILEFRQLESDAISLVVADRNINAVVSGIFSNFKEVALHDHISYNYECNISEKLNGWVDADKVEKIMSNLLTNAFKFTKTNGKISVKVAMIAENIIEIIISDSGYGIEQEKLENIFEYFYTDGKNSRQYKDGIGIGLTYVKRLVDLHKGRISVESLVGEGTKFRVSLPIQKEMYDLSEITLNEEVQEVYESTVLPETVDVLTEESSPKHRKNIPLVMVVEDEKELREYLVYRLSIKFRVIFATNGIEALTELSKRTPDLILSDNVMPLMDGIGLCNEIKNTEEFSHIPFIFLSAWNSEDFKMKGLIMGAEDYISKPFNFEIIETKITNIIEKRRKLKDIASKIVKVKPDMVKIETIDERFIIKAQEIIESNIDNLEFTTKQFEQALSMSHSVVYRKIKSLTGLSANEFIREFRIRRAAQIIEQDRNLSILDVSLMVGFKDQKYFSRCFKVVYGTAPSEWIINKSMSKECIPV